MNRTLVSCLCLGLSLASAAPQLSNLDFTLIRQGADGKALARTSVVVAVVGKEQEAMANLPLRNSGGREWDVRIDLNAEQKLLAFVINEPTPARTPNADPKATYPSLSWFDSRQEWQGPGTYTLCAFGGERLLVRIGPQGQQDLPERKPAYSLVLTKRSADGSVQMMSSMPWMPVKNSAWYLCLPSRDTAEIQPARCWIDDLDDRRVLRLHIRRPASAAYPATQVSHNLWLNLPDGENPSKICEQDGEILELQFLGGIPPW